MLIATLLEARLARASLAVQAALLMFVVISLPDLSLVGTIEPVDAGRVLLVYGVGAVVGGVRRRARRAPEPVLAAAGCSSRVVVDRRAVRAVAAGAGAQGVRCGLDDGGGVGERAEQRTADGRQPRRCSARCWA